MNEFTEKLFIFIAGATVGSVATWYYMSRRYCDFEENEYYDEDIETNVSEENEEGDSMGNDIETTPKTLSEINTDKPNIIDYTDKLKTEGYTDYSNSENLEDETDESNGVELIIPDESVVDEKPYVISPDDFGEKDGYETIDLTYYHKNDIVTDDNDEPVENVNDVIGYDSLAHFGEYEDDSVFVRNDRLKVDYEILLDERDYEDVIKHRPHIILG